MFSRSILLTALAVAASLFPIGCASISESFRSASDSASGAVEAIGGSFESSSRSSGGGGGTQASSNYRRDVQSYTVAYLDEESAPGEYLRGLGRVAGLHGITHWEADQDTLAAIREMVDEGRLDERELERLHQEISPLGEAALAATLGRDS